MAEPLTLGALLRLHIERLKKAGIDNPSLDTRLLTGHVLNLDRARLLSKETETLTVDQQAAIAALIERRLNREPVARILGLREFYGLPFGLNHATLEPRPDSETLITAALQAAHALPPDITILDLGTGSGCLLLTLLHELPQAAGLGIDRAADAIEQAKINAARLNLDTRATFQTGDWLQGLTGTFDLIISNPPYIKAAIIPELAPEVRLFDPMLALDGGEDGLKAYRALIPALSAVMTPRASAIFEIGYDQAEGVSALFEAAGFKNTIIHKDFGGNDRCVKVKL